MREEIILNGKKFLSLKTAARETNYTNDYIGQLCRSEKINSQMVGKIRFVEEDSLSDYVKKANGFVNIKNTDIENAVVENAKDLGDFSSVRDTDFSHSSLRGTKQSSPSVFASDSEALPAGRQESTTDVDRVVAPFHSTPREDGIPSVFASDSEAIHKYEDKANNLYTKFFNTIFSKKTVPIYTAILVLCGVAFGSTLDLQKGLAEIKNKSAEGLAKIVMGAKVTSDKISETALAVVNGEIDYEKVYKNYSNFLRETSVDFAEGEVKYFKNVTGVGSKVTEAIFNPSKTFVAVKSETEKIQRSVEEIIFGGVIYFENLSTNLIRVNEKISQNNFVQEKNLALLNQDSFGFIKNFAIVWHRTVNSVFARSVGNRSDEDLPAGRQESTTAVDRVVVVTPREDDGAVIANAVKQSTTNTVREIIKETVVERVIQTTGITLEDLQKLNNELRSEIYKLSSNTASQITNTYQVISATNNIDNLGGVTIYDSNITNTNISGTTSNFTNSTVDTLTVTGTSNLTGSLTGTTATFTGNLSTAGQLSITGTATSTASGDFAFDTNTLYIDSINNRIGIGTSTPTDTFSINGPTYLAPISAPAVTTDRLYNISNDLYWGGNLVAGSAVGNWTSNGTDVWRASGNVGIGTSSPSSDYRLSVQGDTYIKGNLRVNGNTTISDSGELTVGDKVISEGEIGVGTSSPYAKLAIQGTTVSTTTFGIYGFENQTQPLVDIWDNPTNNSNVFRITSGGNVGIATSSPFRKLSVNGDAWISGNLTANSFTATSSMSSPYFTATDSSATSTFAGGFSVGTNKFVVDYSTGNVGVGTVSPTAGAKLDVSGVIMIADGTVTNPGLAFRSDVGQNTGLFRPTENQIALAIGGVSWTFSQGSLTSSLSGVKYLGGYSTGAANPTFSFNHDSYDNAGMYRDNDGTSNLRFSTNGVERIAILNSGNVGIGTTSPLAKLSVKGAGTTTGINFQTTNSADTPLVTVLDSGNVGIGTVSPVYKLDVVSDVTNISLRVK
ncbi:MAG: hypothetical protein PHX25_02355, partial [Candidatus Pacebacteria bacterium]|nr:hypothetical protein [Candidatus Paceibacterota bacterium]